MTLTIRPNSSLPRWEKISLPFYGDIALGNLTQYRVYLNKVNYIHTDWLFCGITGRSCYVFQNFIHFSYAIEKLELLEGDARNLSDCLNHQLMAHGIMRVEHDIIDQGLYMDRYCARNE